MDSTGTIPPTTTPASPTTARAAEALGKELRDSALLLGLVLLVLGLVVALASAALLL